jgi:DNA-binding NarL/FixJ family response regulator
MAEQDRDGTRKAVEAAFRELAHTAIATPHLEDLAVLMMGPRSYAEIARERGVTTQTVKQQANAVCHALGARSRMELQGGWAAALRRAEGGASHEELVEFFRLRFE